MCFSFTAIAVFYYCGDDDAYGCWCNSDGLLVNGCVQFETRQVADSLAAISDYHRRVSAFPILGFISWDANNLEQSVQTSS